MGGSCAGLAGQGGSERQGPVGAQELKLCLLAGAGTGEVEVVIQDPTGQKGTVEPQLEARGDSMYRCSYQPTMEGVHTVHVTFAGVPIPRSPYMVTVGQGGSGPDSPHACRLGLGLWWEESKLLPRHAGL